MDLVTSDAAILFLAIVGMIGTSVSIVRDAKAQRARLQTEEVPVEVEVRAA
jgi:hypothetical protein